MMECIKNGFRKCRFPLNPNNVDYMKCVKNILEYQRKQLQNNNTETTFSSKEIRSIEKAFMNMG